MGKSADVPEGPDPGQIVDKQAKVNRINTYTPFGSLVYSDTDKGPNTQVTMNMSPEQQQLLSGQQQVGISALRNALNVAGQIPQSALSFEGLPSQVSGIDTSGMTPFQQLQSRSGELQRGLPSRSGQLTMGVDPRTDEVQRNIAFEGLQGLPGLNDFGGERQRVEDAMFGRTSRLLAPEFQQQEERLAQQLANQGLPIGSEAFNEEMNRFQTQRDQTMADLADRAVMAGGQEQSRLFGQALTARGQQFGERMGAGQFANTATGQAFQQALAGAGFGNQAVGQAFGQDLGAGQFRNQSTQLAQGLDQGSVDTNRATRAAQLQEALAQAQLQNQARQQGITERLTERAMPFQELASLQGLAPPPQTPQMQMGGTPVDVSGPYQADANRRAQIAASNSAASGGLFGNLLGLGGSLGGAYILSSDRRLKTGVRRVGKFRSGINWYRFRYLNDDMPRVGFMADEVRKVLPAAVKRINGFDAVDYAMVMEAA